MELDLSTVTPSLSGPKRPHDRVALSDMRQDFIDCLNNRVGFKGFGIPAEKQPVEIPFTFEGHDYKLSHGKIIHQHVQFQQVLDLHKLYIENDVLFSNDTGILGKRNPEFSQQESNLRPSYY